MRKIFAVTLMVASAQLAFSADVYNVDAAHSSIVFAVSHQTVGKQFGRFNKFDGKVELDGDTVKMVSVTIDMNSLDTNHKKRDEHLRGGDFFTVKEFPEATFTSKSVVKKGDMYAVSGHFEMMGKKKEMTLELNITNPVEGRGGSKIRGVHGEFTFKRSEFGVTYGMGGIGDEITVMVAMEVVNK